MLNEGTNVKMTKVTGKDNASLPDEYTCSGVLSRDVVPGAPLLMDRYERNGLHVLGLFNTSIIEWIEKKEGNVFEIKTQNSTWKAEVLE